MPTNVKQNKPQWNSKYDDDACIKEFLRAILVLGLFSGSEAEHVQWKDSW